MADKNGQHPCADPSCPGVLCGPGGALDYPGEQVAERDHTDLRDHQPVIGSFGGMGGIVGCACMDAREWFGYLTSHGGPGWLAYADHIAVQVVLPPGERS